jgi:uncharacterized membrane protein YidH (DUF202 family)
MRTLVGAFLVLVACVGVAVGGLWAYAKAAGAEVDICDGPRCTSGWYYAAPILIGAVVVGVFGVALLRSERRGSGSGSA